LPVETFAFGDAIQIMQAQPEFLACRKVANRAPFQQAAKSPDRAQGDERNQIFVRVFFGAGREQLDEGVVTARAFPIQAIYRVPQLAFHRARHARVAQILLDQGVLQILGFFIQQHQHRQSIFREL